MSRTARALLFAVRVYQTFFSALMPSACKFYPSCSHYAAEAVRVHGARRGSWLALQRVLRCHPFTRGGVDLVPEAGDLPDGTGFTGRGKTLYARQNDNPEPFFRNPFSLSGLSLPERSENRQTEVAAEKHSTTVIPSARVEASRRGEARDLLFAHSKEKADSSGITCPRNDKHCGFSGISEARLASRQACPTDSAKEAHS